jgi:hypothetical protein
MILERVEKDELVKAIYESSNIVASTYNKNNKDLNITFKHGGNYTYQNVSETDYMRFETADSQGKVLNTEIKKYTFLKHNPVNTDDVIKKIREIKAEENTAMAVGLVNLMKETITHFEDTNMLSEVQVNKLTNMIGVYNEMTKTAETA